MKMKYNNSIIMSFIFICILITFSYCVKDKDCYAVINVKEKDDTTRVIAGAEVTLEQGDVEVIGTTDNSGQFRHTFKFPAILQVTVKYRDSINGEGEIFVKAGKTVEETVLVDL